MEGDGLDRARALLEPFRFGFPRVIVALYTFRAKSSREISACRDNALSTAAAAVFPATSSIVRHGWDNITVIDPGKKETCGIFKITTQEMSAHIKLLETVAGYAGEGIDISTIPKAFWAFPDVDNDDYGMQVEPELRWFVHLLADGRFINRPAISNSKLTDLQICDDAFGATWTLLNEALRPIAISPSDSDGLSEKVSTAFQIVKEEGPIQGKALAKRIDLEFSTLRRHIVPKLKALGVKNDGNGYYVAPM
jgi:hypothetical protein